MVGVCVARVCLVVGAEEGGALAIFFKADAWCSFTLGFSMFGLCLGVQVHLAGYLLATKVVAQSIFSLGLSLLVVLKL